MFLLTPTQPYIVLPTNQVKTRGKAGLFFFFNLNQFNDQTHKQSPTTSETVNLRCPHASKQTQPRDFRAAPVNTGQGTSDWDRDLSLFRSSWAMPAVDTHTHCRWVSTSLFAYKDCFFAASLAELAQLWTLLSCRQTVALQAAIMPKETPLPKAPTAGSPLSLRTEHFL